MRTGAAADRDHWVRWRAERLVRAGFREPLAADLAEEGGVDVHALLELVDRGCPPDLAARILAPLDVRPGAGARPRW